MVLLAQLKLDNLYKSSDFTDKKSGEVTKGKWKIQTFNKIDSEDGEQIKLIDISVPDSSVDELKTKVGEEVTIPISTYVANGRVGYYGL